MAAKQHPGVWYCPQDVCDANASLDRRLQRRLGVGVKLWKIIKSLTNLAAVLFAFYATSEGADPELALALVAVTLGGWEILEVAAIDTTTTDSEDNS
jgi:hypothetical protein